MMDHCLKINGAKDSKTLFMLEGVLEPPTLWLTAARSNPTELFQLFFGNKIKR